jgi:hypothetical protein
MHLCNPKNLPLINTYVAICISIRYRARLLGLRLRKPLNEDDRKVLPWQEKIELRFTLWSKKLL